MISRFLAATLLLLLSFATSQAGESIASDTHRLEIDSVDRIVCTDELVSISFTLLAKRKINGKEVWVKAGGERFNVHVYESNDKGDFTDAVKTLFSYQLVTTGTKNGFRRISIEPGSVAGKRLRVWITGIGISPKAYVDIWVLDSADKDMLTTYPAAEALHEAISDLQEADDEGDFATATDAARRVLEDIKRGQRVELPKQSTTAAINAFTAVKKGRSGFATFDFKPLYRLRDFSDGQLFNEAEIKRKNLSKKQIDEVVQVIKNLKLKPFEFNKNQ